MLRNLLSVFVLLSVPSMPLLAGAVTPSELKPVKVDLPDSDTMFPPGPGSDTINNNCLACHSADMVSPVTQPTWY
jgi:hypothetical protein